MVAYKAFGKEVSENVNTKRGGVPAGREGTSLASPRSMTPLNLLKLRFVLFDQYDYFNIGRIHLKSGGPGMLMSPIIMKLKYLFSPKLI